MKRSVCVQLLVTASLLTPLGGCSERRGAGSAASSDWGSDVADDGFDPNQSYASGAYFPRLGYYHPAARWFFPYAMNYYRPGQGYFYGGNWYPVAQPVVGATRPDATRAFAYLTAHRRRRPGYSGGFTSGGHGYYGGYGGYASEAGEGHGIGRGGFGGSGHGSGGA